MTERRWAGALLPTRNPADAEKYPGEQFGLPERGPRSVASMGRRLLALLIDWLASLVVALAVFHSAGWTLVIFTAEVYLLTALTGFTLGKRVLGLRVARLDGKPVGLAVVTRPHAAADHRDPAAGHRPGPARPARPGGQHDRDPLLTTGF